MKIIKTVCKRRLLLFVVSLMTLLAISIVFQSSNVTYGDVYQTRKEVKREGEIPNNNNDILAEMAKRNKHLSKVCESYHDKTLDLTSKLDGSHQNWTDIQKMFDASHAKQYIFNSKHKFVMCMVPKAGSTSLSYAFLKMMKYQPQFHLVNSNGILTKISTELNVMQLEKLHDVTKIINVRHPFIRLLSLFRDKSTFKRSVRSHYSQIDLPKHVITFDEYVKTILNIFRKTWRVYPTPIYLKCLPCISHYDCIIKTESSQDDMKCISKRLNVTMSSYARNHISKVSSNEKHLKNYKVMSETTVTENFNKYYYSMITMEQLLELYKIYEMDFLYFNYTISPFDQYVKKN